MGLVRGAVNRSVIVETVVSFAVLQIDVVLVGVAVVVLLVYLVGVVGGAAVWVAALWEVVVVCGAVRVAQESAVFVVLWCCVSLQCAVST